MKKYKVIRIEEMDYGCEGIPEGEKRMASVLLQDEMGIEMLVKEVDAYLYEKNINVDDMVCYCNQELQKA